MSFLYYPIFVLLNLIQMSIIRNLRVMMLLNKTTDIRIKQTNI